MNGSICAWGSGWLPTAFAVALALAPFESRGEETDPTLDLEKMQAMSLEELLSLSLPVTTASRGQVETAAATPATITIVSKDEIRRSGWRSLAEILTNVPGIYVIDDLTWASLSVRGVSGGLRAGSRIVKIMIDGVQVNFRPELSAFLGPEFLPIEAIEQVEIAKGPLSALYGSNAFLATVNVITRAARPGVHSELAGRGTWQQTSRDPGGGVSALLELGSEAIDLLAAFSADRLDRSGVRIQQTFDNQLQTPERFPYFGRASQSDLARPISGWLKVDFKNERLGVLRLHGGGQHLDSSNQFLLNSVLSGRNRLTLTNVWASLEHQKTWTEHLGTEASFGWSNGAPDSETRLELPTDTENYYLPRYGYRALNLAGSARLAYRLFSVQLGGDYENNLEQVLWHQSVPFAPSRPATGGSPDAISRRLQVGGAYLAAASNPIERLPGLRFTANLRLDHLSYGPIDLPWQYSWRVAASYSSGNDWAAKVFAGRSFQGPSGVLTYAVPGQFGFGATNNIIGQFGALLQGFGGKEPLRPQVVHSIEAAFNSRVGSAVTVEASAFFQQIDDTIRFAPLNNNFIAQNEAAERLVGGEAAVRAAVKRFSGKLAATFTHPLGSDSPTARPTSAIPFFPQFQLLANAEVAVPEARLRFNVIGRVIGQRGASEGNTQLNVSRVYVLPAYGDFDLAVSTRDFHPFGASSETVLTLAARNLIGRVHSEPGYGGFDLPSTGRSFYFELSQRF